MPPLADVHAVLPRDTDLPGSGWVAIDEGFGAAAGPGGGTAELLDCVGPDFPHHAIAGSAATPHWVVVGGPTPRLVHGVGLVTVDDSSAKAAARILSSESFAECLARSVVEDLADAPGDAAVLTVDVAATRAGHRVAFVGSDGSGVRPVHLEVACLRAGCAVGLVWFADSPDPFPPDLVDAVLGAIGSRGAGQGKDVGS